MAENVQAFFELIADSSVFEAAFKHAKEQAGEFAAVFKATSSSVSADADKMGIALQRNLAQGNISRAQVNQLIGQRLAFYGASAQGGGVAADAGRAGGGLGLSAGMFGVYAGLGAVGALAGGAAILNQQITDYANHAAAVLRDSQAIGINAQELQTYQQIAKLTGLDEQSMTTDFERFTKNLEEGAPALKATGFTLKDLGVTSHDVGTALAQLSDWMHKNTDESQKLAVAQALFGRSGGELVPILSQGSAALANYQGQLEKMGALLSNSDLIMGARAEVAIENFSTAFEAAKDRLISAALPGFTMFFQQLSTILVNNGNLWTKIGQLISDDVSFILGIVAGLTGTKLDFSQPPNDAAAAYEGLGGAAQDAADGINGTANATANLSKKLQDEIDALNDAKRARDALYESEKQALEDQLHHIQDVNDTRRQQGEDIVSYERRLEQQGIQDKINALDDAKSTYDRQVDAHIAALEKEKRAVDSASNAMASSMGAGMAHGTQNVLGQLDKASLSINQKMADIGTRVGKSIADWFKDPTAETKKAVEAFGRLLGSAMVEGMKDQALSDLTSWIGGGSVGDFRTVTHGRPPGHASGYFGSSEHLAWISEGNKPEVVLPLNDPARSLALMEQSGAAALARGAGGGGGAGGITTIFNGPVATEFVASKVVTRIDRAMRRRGFNNSRGFGTS